MIKWLLLPAVVMMMAAGCISTSVYVKDATQMHQKRLAITDISINIDRKPGKNAASDTICPCIAQSIRDILTPYFQQAGFTVINIPAGSAMGYSDIKPLTDSMHIDYVFRGTGMVQITGGDYFLHQFSGKIVDLASLETPLTVTQAGTAFRVAKATGKMGAAILKKFR